MNISVASPYTLGDFPTIMIDYQAYEAFIQALPEAIFLLEGNEGRLLAVNNAALQYLGDANWKHQLLQNFIDNPARQLLHCLKYCARTRIAMPITLSFSTHDDSQKQGYEAILIDPSDAMHPPLVMLRHKATEANPFLALNREIDKRRQTHHALQRLEQSQAALRAVTQQLKSRNYALETSNQQLHYEIQQRQEAEQAMKNAKTAAEQANQVKTTFLANMSHELRTPLNAISGFAHLLEQQSCPNTKQAEYVSSIRQNGEYLLTLINDVLDLSKIETGHVQLHPQDFNIDKFLHNLIELFEGRAKQKKLSFVYEPLTELPLGLHADERRLRQIMINLLSNAVKYTEQGGIVLKVSYQDNVLTLAITDTGIGIDKDQLQNIFVPFEQLSDCLHKTSGTGLGLAITQNLVNLMAGELTVTSTPSQGSTFSVSIPIPLALGQVQVPHQDTLRVIGYSGSVRRVLVVDNKWQNRTVLVNMLQPIGFEVYEAENGEQGLAKAATLQPDLILTELVMPVLDGFAMVRQLRQQPELRKACIVGISAAVTNDDDELDYYSGFDSLLHNPLQHDDLLAKLAKLLDLCWIYKSQAVTESTEFAATSPEAEESSLFENILIAPSQSIVRDLLELAMQGDIKGIIQYIDTINCEAQNCPASLFCHRIRELASAFDEERICELLERCHATLESLPVNDSTHYVSH